MSIFSVIKYPLSNPPTQEQLDSIPRELFDHWAFSTIMYHKLTPTNLVMAINPCFWPELSTYEYDMERLKKMIFEIDE